MLKVATSPSTRKVEVIRDSVFKGSGEHGWMRNTSSWLNEICQGIINKMNQNARERLSELVERVLGIESE